MAKSALSSLLSRAHQFSSLSIQATQSSMEPKNNNNNVYKELGLFSLKKKIEDVVNRVEMTTPIALEIEEIKRIKQEEMLMNYNLWDDLARSHESLKSLASSIKVVNELKDLRYKAEEAKLISELVEMDIINGQLFKQAYKASVDVSKLLDRYEMTKLLSGQFDKEGACIIINSGPGGVNSEIWAKKLLTMYINWSRRHGYECRVSEKYPSKNGGDGIRSATLEFEKEFAYGYLSGEKGIHNMIRSSLDGSVVREGIDPNIKSCTYICFSYFEFEILSVGDVLEWQEAMAERKGSGLSISRHSMGPLALIQHGYGGVGSVLYKL